MVADSIQVQAALVFGAVICHDLIYYVGAGVDVPLELSVLLGRAAYTGLASAVFFASVAV